MEGEAEVEAAAVERVVGLLLEQGASLEELKVANHPTMEPR